MLLIIVAYYIGLGIGIFLTIFISYLFQKTLIEHDTYCMTSKQEEAYQQFERDILNYNYKSLHRYHTS